MLVLPPGSSKNGYPSQFIWENFGSHRVSTIQAEVLIFEGSVRAVGGRSN
jgi:hypothetical protein